MARFKQRTRDPDFQTCEITVAEYEQIMRAHEQRFLNDAKVINYAKAKIVTALVEVKGIGPLRAEKACWFTSNKGVAEAEAWLEAHKNDPDIDQPLRLPKEQSGGEDAKMGEGSPANKEAVGGGAMDVDQEGAGAADGTNTTSVDGGAVMGDTAPTENAAFVKEKVTPTLLKELLDMGFPQVRAEKALYFSDNISIEHATNWLMEHEADEDIDKPLVQVGVFST